MKTNCIKLYTTDPKGSGTKFLHHILRMIFQEKYFSNYIPLTDQISLSDCLFEIVGSMYIAIICWPGCYVINFEINLMFLIKPFFYLTKKSKVELKYLENEKSF